MPAIATTSSLNDYPKLSISRYREQLRITQPDSLPVSYKHRGKQYRYSIKLAKTACNYGNYRYWWRCPKCSKRVSVLYCASTYVCRRCINANYQSQLKQPIDHIYSKLNALRERLGWQVGIIHGISERPKGMYHSTYERLLIEYEQLTAYDRPKLKDVNGDSVQYISDLINELAKDEQKLTVIRLTAGTKD